MIVTGFTTDVGVAAFSNMWNYGAGSRTERWALSYHSNGCFRFHRYRARRFNSW